jgi:quercetin dioxygenase-like cupin family protein
MDQTLYPQPILDLPKIDVTLPGVIGHLLQGGASQVVFFELAEGLGVPLHSHEAQWGVVLEGQIEMVIGDLKKVFGPGESYYIPEGTLHSGRAVTPAKALDVFFTPARYKAKA